MRHARPGDIICLFGELGSGKTTLVKGIARGLGIPGERVNSPTFVLMNHYEGRMPLFHFDLYRLEREKEISGLGYEEFLYDGNGVSVIEWAERFGKLLPPDGLRVQLFHKTRQERLIRISAAGERGVEWLRQIELPVGSVRNQKKKAT